MTNGRRIAIIAALSILTLAACATQPYIDRHGQPGFFHGLLHGFIAWATLIVHIFKPEVRMYAFPNAGGWYDFGFLLGVGVWGGGAGASARSKRT